MTLTLKVTSYQQSTLGGDAVKVFEARGGSIGRAAGNDWILPDPERFISSRHASIQFRDGAYYITDTSTNGLFINHGAVPLGNGNSVALNDGDQISLGDYEISVAIALGEGMPAVSPAAIEDSFPDFDSPSTSPTSPTGFFNTPGNESDQFSELGSVDPLAALGGYQKPDVPGPGLPDDDFLAPPPQEQGAMDDSLPGVESFFQPPAAQNEMIPDDWDMTGFNMDSAKSVEAPPPAPPSPPPEHNTDPLAAFAAADQQPATPPPSPAFTAPPAHVEPPSASSYTPPPPQVATPPPVVATPVTSSDAAGLAAFLAGAGMSDLQIPDDQRDQLLHLIGQMVREMVQGMMAVLMARTSLKSEFRMPMTVIRPVENNPLKFSMSVDDALKNLLVRRGGGYLTPLSAVQEGVADIKDHQMAMMAGMQAAFESLLKRFNPAGFEEDAERGSKLGGLLSAGKKAKSWDAYVELYNRIAKEAEDDFQHLFGEEFASAYEEQIDKLNQARGKSG